MKMVTLKTYRMIFAIVDALRMGNIDRAKELAERWYE